MIGELTAAGGAGSAKTLKRTGLYSVAGRTAVKTLKQKRGIAAKNG